MRKVLLVLGLTLISLTACSKKDDDMLTELELTNCTCTWEAYYYNSAVGYTWATKNLLTCDQSFAGMIEALNQVNSTDYNGDGIKDSEQGGAVHTTVRFVGNKRCK